MSVDENTINEFYKMFGKVNNINFAMLGDGSFVMYGQKTIRHIGKRKDIMVSYVNGDLREASKIPGVMKSTIIYVSEPYKTEEADAIKGGKGIRVISTDQERVKYLINNERGLFFE